MCNWLKIIFNWLNKIFPWLFKTDMPVWLSLLIIIVGALGTYFFVPYINVLSEQDKIRTAYILDNLKKMNGDTSELLNNIRKFKFTLQNGGDVNTVHSSLENQITKLQWRVLEYDVIFGDKKTHDLINSYKTDLTTLSNELAKKKKANINQMYCHALNFIKSSHRILQLIAKRADLTIETEPFFKIPDNINCLVKKQ